MARKRWWKRRGAKLTTPDGLSAVTLPPGYIEVLSAYGLRGSYGYIYRTQPNVRSVIDFLADEVAGIKLKHYEKVPTTPTTPSGRLELEDSDLQELLNRPSPGVARSRFWRETVADIGVYDVAYWAKVRLDGRVRAVRRLPPTALFPRQDPATRLIRWYETSTGTRFMPDELVVFHGYDPEMMEGFISPLETLRRVLAEEYAAGVNREHNWRNQARKGGVVERPETAPVWDDDQREAWRVETEGITAGAANAGRILLLEDGMKWNDSAWSPEEMEYLEARKLTRQECAAAFRVDPRLVFATSDAVTADVRTNFYTDRLMPLLTRLAEEIEVQLLPDLEPLAAQSRQYVQFNIDTKMRGSFLEEAKIASTTVGGPVVTMNEWRARHNLPPIPGGDAMFIPLNSVRGGGPQASPQAPIQTPGEQPAGVTPGGGTQVDDGKARLESELATAWLDGEAAHHRRIRQERVSEAVRRHLSRQERTIGSLVGALKSRASVAVEDVWLDGDKWDRELASDLEGLGLNGDSTLVARRVNEMTKLRLGEALQARGDVRDAFRWDEEALDV